MQNSFIKNKYYVMYGIRKKKAYFRGKSFDLARNKLCDDEHKERRKSWAGGKLSIQTLFLK